MKKFGLVRGLLLMGSLGAWGHGSAYEEVMMWRIEREPPVFLFGTIHVDDPRVLDIPKLLEDVIALVDEVAVEVLQEDIWNVDESLLYLPNNQKNTFLVPFDLRISIDRLLSEVNPRLNYSLVEDLKVWVLANSLQPLLETARSGGQTIEDPYVLDEFIEDLAYYRGKRVSSLESALEQINALDRLPLSEQVQMLREAVESAQDPFGGDWIMEMLIEFYLSGEIEGFFEGWQEFNATSGMQTILFEERNEIMATRMAYAMDEEPESSFLFAVGAGHYLGDRSVIDLLENEGYVITRLTKNWPWSLLPDYGNGWRNSDWFGWFSVAEGGMWSHHFDLDWVYTPSFDQDSMWFWFPDMGWLWTQQSVYPVFYNPSEQKWVRM